MHDKLCNFTMNKLEKTKEGYYQVLDSWHSLYLTTVQLHRVEGECHWCSYGGPIA